jgi:hypothetical protein
MSVTVVRYRTKPDRGDENQALIEQVFQELRETRPAGLRYTSLRLDDGVSFVHVAIVDTADGSNPLGATAAFQEFTRAIGDRCEEPPVATAAPEVGHYFPGAT